jgi:hypothetical protein
MKLDGIRFARWSGNLAKLDDEIVIEATGNMSMPAEPKRHHPQFDILLR